MTFSLIKVTLKIVRDIVAPLLNILHAVMTA